MGNSVPDKESVSMEDCLGVFVTPGDLNSFGGWSNLDVPGNIFC